MKKKDFVKVSIYLPEKIVTWLAREAEKNGMTSSAFIRYLLVKSKNETDHLK